MSGHALLSASGSHKWLNCPPSAVLEQDFENTTSIFALEGTAAHELSEYKINTFLGNKVRHPQSEFDSPELEEYTDIYVDFAIERITEARTKCRDPIILVEKKLDYSCYVPEGYGTGDLVIVADDVLDIVDLKYGKGVAVDATGNPQMMLYAIGALLLFQDLYDIRTVRMSICQPRLDNISTYEISTEDLLTWAEEEVAPKAKLAIQGLGDFNPGGHCRWCRARQTCRTRAEAHMELVKYEFKAPALLTDEEIAEVLEVADRLSTWASDVYVYASDRAINEGKEWSGFKVVSGRSKRKYVNEEAVIKVCEEQGITDIYKQSLVSLTGMEKLLGKNRFQQIIGPLVEVVPGKPTLVPVSDKRKILNNTAEADFREEF